MKRRDFFRTAGIASATLVSFPDLAGTLANSATRTSLDGKPADKFTILLAGIYKPVVNCRDLGLSTVNVCDGSYFTTRIHPVNGLPLDDDSGEDSRGSRLNSPACQSPIGRFYVQLASLKNCAYDLPGGTLAMVFTGNTLVSVPDTEGGAYLVGTIDLDITEATGVYRAFVGGHNKMVDIFRKLADGTLIENCFCNISRP